MNLLRSILPLRAVVLLLSVEILNLSIDPPDLLPNHPEDLSVNDIESITELVLENVFGVQNAMKELEDQDTPDGSPFTLKVDLYSSLSAKLHPKPYFFILRKSYNELQNNRLNSVFSEIASPPPKV